MLLLLTQLKCEFYQFRVNVQKSGHSKDKLEIAPGWLDLN